MALLLVAAAVAPGPLDPVVLTVQGPVGSRAFGGALRTANQLALLVAILVILGGAASLGTRFRHARGTERQQLRWVALAAALTGLAMLVTGALVAVGDLALAAWTSVIGTLFLPWPSGRRSCATGSMTWTGSSAGPWPTGCSRSCSASATPPSCSAWAASCPRAPAGPWPRPP
jgi:hypothetical protein